MNGFDVLEALQKEHRMLPVIVCTNLSQDVDEERARAYGASQYFVKSESAIADIVAYVTRALK
jgi:CheY-like chemotaxis protein